MNHEELMTHLKVLAQRARSSNDREVQMASVVLCTLVGSLLIQETELLAKKAGEFSAERIKVHTKTKP